MNLDLLDFLTFGVTSESFELELVCVNLSACKSSVCFTPYFFCFLTITTIFSRSMIHFDPKVGHLNLAIVALLNIVGYVIYRYEILTLF